MCVYVQIVTQHQETYSQINLGKICLECQTNNGINNGKVTSQIPSLNLSSNSNGSKGNQCQVVK